jgi:hypothetical protein
MKSVTTIKLETYSCALVIIITDQLKTECKKIYKKYKIEAGEESGEDEGVFISTDITKYFLLIDSKYLSHNTIAHEIYHAVVGITEDRGITDEEAQSWLCGHLSGTVYKFLDKKKLQIKHG